MATAVSQGVKEAAGLVEVALDRGRESVHEWERTQEYSISRRSELLLHRRVPLPRALFEQYSYLECKSFLGIFPEIHRAWFTVDNRLFLWNYATGSDFYPYEGVDQIITAAAIVEPKPGVFVEDVKYVLALSTPVEVVLLGVCFSGPAVTSEITLVPTQMVISTDNVAMLKMVGSKSRRLFMAGRDGCLNELTYHGELESFWSFGSRKARRLNHSKTVLSSLVPVSVKLFFFGDDPLVDLAVDDSRDLLYSLSECGIVTVYDIGKASRASKIASSDAVADSRRYSPASSVRERAFLNIFTVPQHASSSTHLVLVTSLGERIYYSLRSGRGGTARGLTAIAFRGTPPLHSETRPLVHTAAWIRGVLALADARGGETDTLVVVSPESTNTPRSAESFRFRSPESSVEVVAEKLLDAHGGFAKAWAIAEAPRNASEGRSQWDTGPPRDLIVLTNSAIQLYVRLEPRDQLEALLSHNGGGTEATLRNFINEYGAREVCAMCYAIVSEKPRGGADSTDVVANATRVLVTMGGDPTFEDADLVSSPYAVPRGPQFDIGRPSSSIPPLRFSGAHDGFCLHLARVLSPVWWTHITSSRNPDDYQTLNIPKDELLRIRENLLQAAAFLEKNLPALCSTEIGQKAVGTQANGSAASIQERLYRGLLPRRRGEEAKRLEQVSFGNLKAFAERAAESLALLSLWSDHHFHRLFASLSPAGRQELSRLRFCELAVTDVGASVASLLLEALFASYSDEPNVVDALGEALKERSGSFFGPVEANLYRGLALVRQAARAKGPEAAALAADAVRALKPYAGRIVDLPAICADLRSANAIPSMAELVSAATAAAEASGDASLLDDACKCTFDTLQSLLSTGDSAQERMAEAMLRVLMNNPSEEFGERLYNFLVDFGPLGTDMLFRFPSARVDRFLGKRDQNLLWRYLAKQGRHLEAARVLCTLAEDLSFSCTLSERVSLLASAVHNAKVASANSSDELAAPLLREVGDKLDVAQVQLRVVEELKRRRSGDPDVPDVVAELDTRLLDLSSLYNKYARPWELWESELDCLRCASYRDDELVKRLWTEIVDAELRLSSDSPAGVRSQMVVLGRDFHPSASTFPVDFIAELLERKSIERRSKPAWREASGWVAATLLEAGVARRDIAGAYAAILDRREIFDDQTWNNSVTIYLIETVVNFLTEWTDVGSRSHADQTELGSGLGNIMKLVSLSKGLLRTMTEPSALTLIKKLDSLEVKADKAARHP